MWVPATMVMLSWSRKICTTAVSSRSLKIRKVEHLLCQATKAPCTPRVGGGWS